MSNHVKMNLADLQPKPIDGIDWNILDIFFDVDAPNALGSSLVLTRTVADLKLLEMPEVDNHFIMAYLQKMAKDTEMMSNSLAVMRTNYQVNKARYQDKYDENAHMFSLSISHDMQDWLEQYENTIGQSIEDVTNYINSIAPKNNNDK